METGNAIHGSAGGGAPPIGAAAAGAASPAGSDITTSTAILGTVMTAMMGPTVMASSTDAYDVTGPGPSTEEEGSGTPEALANAPIQDKGEGGAGGSGGGFQGGEEGSGGGSDNSGVSDFSTSQESSSGAAARLEDQIVQSSFTETAAAQVVEVDSITTGQRASNAQLEAGIAGANAQKTATDVSASTAMLGAVASSGMAMAGSRGSDLSKEDQVASDGLSKTKEALEPPKEPPPIKTVETPDQSSVNTDKSKVDTMNSPTATGDEEGVEMTTFKSSTPNVTADTNRDSISSEDYDTRTSTTSDADRDSTGSIPDENYDHKAGSDAETTKTPSPTSPAYSPDEKAELMSNGFIKDDPDGVKTKAAVKDLSPAEVKSLKTTVTKQQGIISAKETALSNANSARSQKFDALGSAANTVITQSGAIDAAKHTQTAQIDQTLQSTFGNAFSVSQQGTQVGAALLSAAQSAVSSVLQNITSLLVNNQ